MPFVLSVLEEVAPRAVGEEDLCGVVGGRRGVVFDDAALFSGGFLGVADISVIQEIRMRVIRYI